ncbi:zinc-binding alcohol dehydrogenase family protein [Promicromonospora citrea]|uniref:Alcohol dehydrogenase n=1 Tax=Promicromonospora citrea TaxID=43677 RepID=A0A8H9GEZ8_9MICO|nr:zinc-binding alcohol dehydrogenase family protein [Promicromonospora citrea]NNH52734.1 zinc-binding alcohol dehydrogenase family protein [Promicromonospora citrea]GGM16112.1 alcohol dehydrogenase [Promicromonospora citrea]
MRAAVVTSPDRPPAPAEFPEPETRPGQEPLHLVGAGLHHVVRGLAAGRHYESTNAYPLVPGVDAVARAADGRLVYTGFPRAPWGTMAERLVTPFALDVPDGADPLAVAAGMNPAMSGWMVLTARRAEVGRLGTVLVLGATGMSGSLAVRAALALGADRVLAAGRDRTALERLAALDVVPVPLGEGGDLARAVAQEPPTLVLDFVWGPVAEAAFAALAQVRPADGAPETAYAQIGSLAGETAAVPASLLRSRRIRVTGSGIGSVSREALLAEAPAILDRFADGTFDVPYTAYPLSEVGAAWAHRGRDRVVVVPDSAVAG